MIFRCTNNKCSALKLIASSDRRRPICVCKSRAFLTVPRPHVTAAPIYDNAAFGQRSLHLHASARLAPPRGASSVVLACRQTTITPACEPTLPRCRRCMSLVFARRRSRLRGSTRQFHKQNTHKRATVQTPAHYQRKLARFGRFPTQQTGIHLGMPSRRHQRYSRLFVSIPISNSINFCCIKHSRTCRHESFVDK